MAKKDKDKDKVITQKKSFDIEEQKITIHFITLISITVFSFLTLIASFYIYKEEISKLVNLNELTKNDLKHFEDALNRNSNLLDSHKESIMGLNFRVNDLEKKINK